MGIIQSFFDRLMDERSRPSRAQSESESRANPRDLLSQAIMQQVISSVKEQGESEQVLYSDNKQHLDVAGENYRGDVFKNLKEKYQPSPREEIGEWFSGVLLPEPTNPYDPRAVMVILLDQDAESMEIVPLHVGYMDKAHAANSQPQITRFWKEGKVIPLQLKIRGGTPQIPPFLVTAFAMTSAIQF